jgi:ABC-2 type transport system ATP-binding protein
MINISNLHFSYGRKPVFSGLNLRLGPGTICGLLGRNGTGKSTLLRNIGGFLFPQEGAIETLGFQPGRRQPAFLEQVLLVPETFQLPAISMRQWLTHTTPFYRKFDRTAFTQYIKDFDVPASPRLTELSYGQQKKALISFALATNAPLLLMDEPTNGLDIAGKSQFRKIIAGAIDESRAILISTHQVKDLEQLIDRILIIDEGKIVFDQPLAKIADRLLFKFSFDPEEEAQSLYCETSFRGSSLILPNTEQKESRPDLEMLYKAVTTDPVTINTLFK